MVWASVNADSCSPLEFMDRGVKINAEYYRNNVLKIVLKPWLDKHFGRRPRTFQQDSAWVKKEVVRFISAAQWPPKSPDLNPLDCSEALDR